MHQVADVADLPNDTHDFWHQEVPTGGRHLDVECSKVVKILSLWNEGIAMK